VLLSKRISYFIFLIGHSQNKQNNEVEINNASKYYSNKLITIKPAYSKSPLFEEVFPFIESIFNGGFNTIAELATLSVVSITNYLKIDTEFLFSSKNSAIQKVRGDLKGS